MGYIDKHHCKTPKWNEITVENADALRISGQFHEYWECPVEGCYRLWQRKEVWKWVKTIEEADPGWFHRWWYSMRAAPSTFYQMTKSWEPVYIGWELIKPDKRVLVEAGDGTVREVLK